MTSEAWLRLESNKALRNTWFHLEWMCEDLKSAFVAIAYRIGAWLGRSDFPCEIQITDTPPDKPAQFQHGDSEEGVLWPLLSPWTCKAPRYPLAFCDIPTCTHPQWIRSIPHTDWDQMQYDQFLIESGDFVAWETCRKVICSVYTTPG
jgi:hypothetical protein